MFCALTTNDNGTTGIAPSCLVFSIASNEFCLLEITTESTCEHQNYQDGIEQSKKCENLREMYLMLMSRVYGRTMIYLCLLIEGNQFKEFHMHFEWKQVIEEETDTMLMQALVKKT